MKDDVKAAAETSKSTLVWDMPTRLFHWCLVLLVGTSWLTGELGEMDWHMRSGFAILTLVLFRLLWGVFGSTTARFAQFVKPPAAAVHYARDLISGKARTYLGHNPLGGWMVVLLLSLLLFQTGTGLFANDDIFTEGPLYHLVTKSTSDWLTVIHKTLFDALLICVGLHVAAAIFYLVVKKDNLILPMINGRKSGHGADSGFSFVLRSSFIALLSLAAAAAAVWAIVTLV
ncbi:cytochrome b/b6 domain-containing protein [Pelagibius sp. Alg239-R121]|uniref:cytochrome b/b6 domain-containing protein n=1 Tax=Pelagibius sp. Alg239-R121 TaxID=2993448 RepID=UPI0024A68D0D|nr:cytochrome b/b6 domain-containing protein [Pelagibius sp. Alg239-R121]